MIGVLPVERGHDPSRPRAPAECPERPDGLSRGVYAKLLDRRRGTRTGPESGPFGRTSSNCLSFRIRHNPPSILIPTENGRLERQVEKGYEVKGHSLMRPRRFIDPDAATT